MLRSYRALRRIVGFLGVALPIVVAVWGGIAYHSLQNSISEYYVLPGPRDILVGFLFAIGAFLYAYHGPQRVDDYLSSAAGLLAVGVALCPVTEPGTRNWHLVFAGALFAILACFSLFLFTRSGGHPTPRKLKRNRIYRWCGVVMAICLVAIGAYQRSGSSATLLGVPPVLACETLLLWAFGLSWFVKGDTLLRDELPTNAVHDVSS